MDAMLAKMQGLLPLLFGKVSTVLEGRQPGASTCLRGPLCLSSKLLFQLCDLGLLNSPTGPIWLR
jgi:hypothetical protein